MQQRSSKKTSPTRTQYEQHSVPNIFFQYLKKYSPTTNLCLICKGVQENVYRRKEVMSALIKSAEVSGVFKTKRFNVSKYGHTEFATDLFITI